MPTPRDYIADGKVFIGCSWQGAWATRICRTSDGSPLTLRAETSAFAGWHY